MWKGSRQMRYMIVFLVILSVLGSELPLVLSIRGSSRISESNRTCNEHCGNVAIPYPFFLKKGCGKDGFQLLCINNTLKIELNLAEYVVSDIFSDSIVIDPLRDSCHYNLDHLIIDGLPNFALSSHNVLQLSDCNDTSGCQLGCGIPVDAHFVRCDFVDSCCYPLYNTTIWEPGNDLTPFFKLNCKTFTSWTSVKDSPALEYGLKLEWAVPDTCDKVGCAANAHCENSVAVKGCVRCTCNEGYTGDGFEQGIGCLRVCRKHGVLAYDTDCESRVTVNKILVLSAGILVSVAIVAATVFALVLVSPRRAFSFRRKWQGDRNQLKGLLSLHGYPRPIELFTYETLEKATKKFSSNVKCGHGACGTVYAGELNDGRIVAVKRMHFWSSEGVQQLFNEISLLSTVKHKNLVQLFGCCLEGEDPILVYEFVPNGTLTEHLRGEKGERLDWCTRIAIVTDASQALAYLHSTISPPIYHRDVKSCNILLDFDFNCKVADFGLSKLALSEGSHISTVPQGTPGYLDPDYHQTYHLSDKSDVYSFGVVLIEIITAMKPVDFARDGKEVNLAAFAVSRITSGCLDGIIDPFLQVNQQPSVRAQIQRVAELAFRCLSYDKDSRPTMIEVAQELLLIKKASMPVAGSPRADLLNLYESRDTADKLLCSPTSVQALWPSNSTTASEIST